MLLGRTRLGLAVCVAASSLGIAPFGCGAKSALRIGAHDGGDAAVVQACETDADCVSDDLCAKLVCREGFCSPGAPVVCDDKNECTEDNCDPATAQCSFRPLTHDEDGDGHPGPRPGFKPGEPGACGDDCDDTSDKAFPGGVEVCDGVDNDCNGIIDDGMRYEPIADDAVLVSSGGYKDSSRGGIAWNETVYGVTYTGHKDNWRNFFKGLDRNGATAIDELPITNIAGTAFTGPILYNGAIFATAWEDRRDQNYEVWFNRLDSVGAKLGPDLRITNAGGFSLHPALLWNGSEFILAWDDDRDGTAHIFARRIDPDGNLIGDEIELTPLDFGETESPSLAEGDRTVAVAFNRGEAQVLQAGMRLFQPDLTGPGDLITLSTSNAVTPVVAWSRDRYVAVWETKDVLPGDAIWGATIAEDGTILQSERRVTSGSQFARTPALLPLGDRLLLVWAQYTAGNYELFSKMLSPTLEDMSSAARITRSPGDSVGPATAFGPAGDVGVLFEDTRSGPWQVYFARLVCTAGN